MKKIQRTKADNFYIFMGRSNANSCFIENLEDAKLFLTYANYYLRNFLKVYDYMINEEGWIMVVKIHHEEDIRDAIGQGDFEVWRVISEQMRKFLSSYVVVSNRSKRRTGCLVHSSYERFYFETLTEAMSVINDIRQQRFRIYDGIGKYRSNQEHYEITQEMGSGSIFICSKRLRRPRNSGKMGLEFLTVQGLTQLVLQKMVNMSYRSHTNHPTAPNDTISSILFTNTS